MSTLVAARVPVLVVEDDLEMQFLIREHLHFDSRMVRIADTTSTIEAVALTQKNKSHVSNP